MRRVVHCTLLSTATVHARTVGVFCQTAPLTDCPPVVETFHLFLRVVRLAEHGGQALTPQTGLTSPSSIAPTAHWFWQIAALCPVSISSFSNQGTGRSFVSSLISDDVQNWQSLNKSACSNPFKSYVMTSTQLHIAADGWQCGWLHLANVKVLTCGKSVLLT